MNALHSFFGLLGLTLLAWLLSENRRMVLWRPVLTGLALQIVLGIVLLKLPYFKEFFLLLNRGIEALQIATRAGTTFVFGYLGGGDFPVTGSQPGSTFVLAFQAMPIILVMSAISALLFHWGILQKIVGAFSRLLEKSLGVGGALGLGAAANIFVGMVEAPLLVRPYLQRMGRDEIFALMTCGMATIAGTMMALYGAILGPVIPDAMGHILIASILSAPAALTVSMLLVPARGEPTEGTLQTLSQDSSAMDAITRGTLEGVQLLIQVLAMLVVLVALVALVNQFLGLFPDILGEPLTLQRALGWCMAPVVWLTGIPWSEAQAGGMLMGIKTVQNEFIAYLDLAHMPEETLSERSRLIMTYSLCGFANFGSLGILIGGLGAMAPERRGEIVAMGMKSILSGTLATLMTGCVAGMLL